MRVLIVLPQPPTAEGGAAARCSIALMRGLRAHGVDATALAAHHPFSPAGPVPPDLDVEVVDVTGTRPRPWSSPIARWRCPLGTLLAPQMAARLADVATRADVVHFDQVESAGYGPCAGKPSALHLHYRVHDHAGDARWWSAQCRYEMEVARAERQALDRFGWLVATSPVVARSLGRVAARITTASLSIEPPAACATLDGPPRLGLIGTAQWPPTRAAMLRLVRRLWPVIRRRVPEAELHIAGRGTLQLLGALQVPGLVVMGEVERATGFLAGLSALLYPVTRGSGMKVKVLESIAIGLPVITTSAGAEGIGSTDGVIVHDDDAALAEAAVALLQDDGHRRARGASARQTFDACHAPAPATAPLAAFYRTMLSAS